MPWRLGDALVELVSFERQQGLLLMPPVDTPRHWLNFAPHAG